MDSIPPMKNTSSGGMQLVVALSFLLGTVAAIFCLFMFAPFIPLFPGIIGCMAIGMVVSGILGRVLAKREGLARGQAHREYRDDREAEKLKKINEMRAKNSNVPKVKRQMFATKNNDE